MNQRWPTWKFALVVIPSLLFIAFIVSLFFEMSVITAVMVAATVFSLILQYGLTGTDHDATDHPGGKEDTDETIVQQPSDGQQEPALSQESNSDTSSIEEDVDGTAEPDNKSLLTVTNDEIVQETEEELVDHITFYENRIRIDPQDLNLYSGMMLHVIAKHLAYEHQRVDSPEMTVTELQDQSGDDQGRCNMVEVLIFLEKAGEQLTPSYSLNTLVNSGGYADFEDVSFTVELEDLAEITEWVLNEDHAENGTMDSKMSLARTALNDARDRYKKLEAKDAPPAQQDYSLVIKHVLGACRNVKQYPIEVGTDTDWYTFTGAAESLINSVKDDLPGKTPLCLDEMERALDSMEDKVSDVYYL